MSWIDLQIHLPDHVATQLFGVHGPDAHANPHDFRKLIAKLNDAAGKQIPPELFNYGDNGPINGMSKIRFGTFNGGVRLYGVGSAGVDFVETYGHKVRRLLADMAGVPLQESRSQGLNKISRTAYPQYYRMGTLVFEPWHQDITAIKAKLTKTAADQELPEIRALILQAVKDGIIRQVKDVHCDDPQIAVEEDGADIELEHIPFELIGLEFVHHVRVTKPHDEKQRFALAAKSVVVATPLKLDGIWHSGALCARGFGKMSRIPADVALGKSSANELSSPHRRRQLFPAQA